jgi:C_GCAxxG_C_C family probable redox protein
MKKTELALQLFSEKYSCAQAVLMAFAADHGLSQQAAAKVACAFGGGISHLGLSCGAVTGALMVLGLKYGGPPEMKEGTYTIAREFVSRFSGFHGSINCTELIGYDLADPDQIAKARELGVFGIKCSRYVETAVEILEELLQ